MKKKIKIIVVLLLLVAAGCGVSQLFSSDAKELSWRTATATKGVVERVVTATGRLVPMEQVEVGSEVSGTIAKLYTSYNDLVKKGAVLAQIDKSKLQAQLAQQQATLASAKNEFSFREKQHARTQALVQSGAAGGQELENAEYQLESARAALTRAQAQLDQARVDLRNSTIVSPMDGVVLDCAVEEGQTVAASFSAPTLFVIARNLEKMKVETDIDEADVGMVQGGQTVRFRVDAFPSKQFSGKLTQVRLNPTNNSGVITYTVIIEADNSELLLLPGMTANVDIVVETAEDVITVPVAAQRFATKKAQSERGGEKSGADRSPSPKGETLYLLQEGKATPVSVTSGTSNGSTVAILSGIKEGAAVIVGEQSNNNSQRGGKGNNNPFAPATPRRR